MGYMGQKHGKHNIYNIHVRPCMSLVRMRVIALGMAVCLFLTAFLRAGISVAASNILGSEAVPSYTLDEEYISEMISNNYTKASARYAAPYYQGETMINAARDMVEGSDGAMLLTGDTRAYEGADEVLRLSLGDVVTLSVEVPQTARYFVSFDFLSYDESVLPVGVAMMVDGEYPFYECRTMKWETTWTTKGERAYDRYGDEIVTMPDKLVRWENKYLMDSSYRHSRPLDLELAQGRHELTFTVKEGNFLLGAVILEAPYWVPEYGGSPRAEGDALIQIQAEDFTYRNDSAIHAIAEYETNVVPYEVRHTALNTIDGDSFRKAGQKVTYEFAVEKAGYYYIGMNYKQAGKSDFQVFVDVEIDGTIPNSAFQSFGLKYSRKYKTISLTDGKGDRVSVYLEPGMHTVAFAISNDPIRHILEGLDEVMSGVNDLSLEITKVAGTNTNKYRDLRLSRYIPNLDQRMMGYTDKLNALHDSVLGYTSSKKTVSVLSSMSIAARQIASLSRKPDEIPYRVGELASNPSSANHHLANTVDALLGNNLGIDRIYIYQEGAVLPKKPNIFAALWMNLSRFFTSFTKLAYSANNTNPEHLQVWVNRSTQYVQTLQKMIDETFTPRTGIEVDISIMPDQRKLVLSNTAGQSPDVATGINYTIPYELAVREALVDMTQFAGFKETARVYNPGFFLTACINDKIYAMPETMNFWVLFYRSDILTKLGLEIPDTMQDVIDMLPDLQMRGLNFYQSASGMLQMRNFHGTTPLIHQFGGSVYGRTAQEGTMFGSPESIRGFTYLTELYTIYNLPINIDNFYQHLRNGDMPLGIADYFAYNLMTNAAPELKGAWGIALVPGTQKEDGTIDRTICGCADSTVIFKSDPEREAMAWEFVKWWASTPIQAQYGQTMQVVYGEDYMWNTANMEAFMQLPWDTQDKDVIAEQLTYVVDIARVPGTYMVEREMSNAFNDIVVDGLTAQPRIDKAVKTINREVFRKLEEFQFIDSEGNTLKEYRIPTMESVKVLLGRE